MFFRLGTGVLIMVMGWAFLKVPNEYLFIGLAVLSALYLIFPIGVVNIGTKLDDARKSLDNAVEVFKNAGNGRKDD
jgi:uncharacterized membrane protein (Fun14 family)